MKVLKYILASLGIVILAFVLFGSFLENSELKHEYRYSQSPKVVFLTVIDPRKMHSWIDGLEKIEPVNGFLNGIGAKYLVTVNYDNNKYTLLEELVTFEFYKELGMILFPPHMEVRIDMSFTEENKSTKINLNTVITGDNAFWKSMVFLKKPAINNIILNDLKNLEQILNNEAQTTSP